MAVCTPRMEISWKFPNESGISTSLVCTWVATIMVVCGTHTLARARCPPLAAASAGCMCSGTHQLVRATAHATCRHRSYDNFLEVHEQLKARSRKYPGLAKRQNRFHTTKDGPESHEHLLRVCSDKWATPLRHKATYTSPLSRHTNRASMSFFHPFLTHATGRPP